MYRQGPGHRCTLRQRPHPEVRRANGEQSGEVASTRAVQKEVVDKPDIEVGENGCRGGEVSMYGAALVLADMSIDQVRWRVSADNDESTLEW